MKILAISDVVEWEGLEEVVDENQPEVIVLAGDLTSDGFASFWFPPVEQIPAYENELKKLNIGYMMKGIATYYRWIGEIPKEFRNRNLLDIVEEIAEKYKKSKEYLELRAKAHALHVSKFYQFLEFAGKKSQVLVVKGDHDEDFEGKEYLPDKIDKIFGCKEISGKPVLINNLCFLGLGFNETHYLRVLKPLVEKFKDKIDVVVTHCEQNRLPIVSLLKPKLIIRGHFGSGKYLINGIPSVFTSNAKYSVIEFEAGKLPNIQQYITNLSGKIKILEKGSCKPWGSASSEFEKYPWIKPYPF